MQRNSPESSRLPEYRAAAAGTATQALTGGASDIQDLIFSCNKDGMESLRRGDLKSAFDQFKYAEAILLANQTVEAERTALLAVTCNNLGCYYKKLGKFHGALSYLRRSLKMEVEINTDEVTLAGTHLNLCAVLSKLEKHDKAVQHALNALQLMSHRINEVATATATQDEYIVLAIAWHSVALEREFLQQWDQAATAFQTGYQVAKRLIGESHPLTMALEQSCNAVLRKAKDTKAKAAAPQHQPLRADKCPTGVLPPLSVAMPTLKAGASALQGGDAATLASPRMLITRTSTTAIGSLAEWLKSEELEWARFAQSAFSESTAGPGPAVPAITLDAGAEGAEGVALPAIDKKGVDADTSSANTGFAPSPLADLESTGMLATQGTCHDLMRAALQDMKDFGLVMPRAYDMGEFSFSTKRPQHQVLKKTPLGQALDDHPEAIMDILDADGDGHNSMRSAPNDFRPHRSMKRTTRVSRVVRRTGVFNSTTYRDRIEVETQRKRLVIGAPWKSAHAQRLAAERIQQAWRMYYEYCNDEKTAEWMTISWICATMIQSHWRSYHVRRQRLDKFAMMIQRHCRGFLVRCVLKSHTAAVTIQRRVAGMLTRRKLQRLHQAATTIQSHAKGGFARRRYKEMRRFRLATTMCIQRYVRAWMARRVVTEQRAIKYDQGLMTRATLNLQRMFRGWKGRQFAEVRRQQVNYANLRHDSARKIQSLYRTRKARTRMNVLQQDRRAEMEKAATFVRKVWLGAKMRKKYQGLQEEFKLSEEKIVTIQRYMRGCLCRLRLWYKAVKQEEELWAAVEVQRAWRGLCGRRRWLAASAREQRCEAAARVLQRNVRGFLARHLVVARLRRRLARADFERARNRFRAVQKIQALARGVLVRKAFRQRQQRVTRAATCIQRIQRGQALRAKLCKALREQKSTIITAAARGFLVRNRRRHLLAKVISIQRAYRRWLAVPRWEREARTQHMVLRKCSATKIQRFYRHFAEKKEIRRIQASAT
jgi:tetratricopeptide (TPR) repeat protein